MKALSLTRHIRSAALPIAVLFTGCTVGSTSTLMKDLDNANATRLAYYNAGTFVSALQDITATAAEQKKAADEKIDETKPGANLVKKTPKPPGS